MRGNKFESNFNEVTLGLVCQTIAIRSNTAWSQNNPTLSEFMPGSSLQTISMSPLVQSTSPVHRSSPVIVDGLPKCQINCWTNCLVFRVLQSTITGLVDWTSGLIEIVCKLLPGMLKNEQRASVQTLLLVDSRTLV